MVEDLVVSNQVEMVEIVKFLEVALLYVMLVVQNGKVIVDVMLEE